MGSTAEVKNSFSFVKGFITEASALTFPEDASLDEENYNLFTDGSRRKRLGIDFEDGFSLVSSINSTAFESSTVETYLWATAAEIGGFSILVVQIGNIIEFFDASGSELAISDPSNKLSDFIDLNGLDSLGLPILAPTFSDAGTVSVSFSDGKGLLFINSEAIEPLVVTVDPDTLDITTEVYSVQIRDFDGVEDGLDIEDRPVTLSNTHKYNLRNQGWPLQFRCANDRGGDGATLRDPIEHTKGIIGVYPSNTDILFFSKLPIATAPENVGTYFPEELQKNLFGSTRAPRGHFLLDAFNKDYTDVSGISGLDSKIIDSRPEAVSFYSGRVFLGLKSTLYYSQILTSPDKIGRCYAESDPTAEDINEVVATDGGSIEIPNAGIIKQLIPVGTSLIVLATEGVWRVDGSRDPFSATNNQAIQISTTGVTDNKSGILVENTVLYTANTGILSVSPDSTTGELSVTSLTEQTIREYYLSNVKSSETVVRGSYDPTTRKVFWLWGDESPTERYFDVLVLDTTLGAFHKYRLNSTSSTFPHISSSFTTPEVSSVIENFNVVTASGDNVVDSLGNQVISRKSRTIRSPISIKFLAVVPGTTNVSYTFAELTDNNLVDWFSHDSVGLDYEAFLETGYEINEDQMRFKQAPLIQTSFNQTETSFVDNGSGGVEFDTPSSCKLRAQWDWSDNIVSGKITNEQEVYRFRRNYLIGEIGEAFITGLPVVTSRTKLRGRGRSLHLRFRTPAKMHTELLGWSILYKSNDTP